MLMAALLSLMWPVLFPCACAQAHALNETVLWQQRDLGGIVDGGDWASWLIDSWEVARRGGRRSYSYVLDDLPSQQECLWAKIKANGRDEAYMNLIGLDKAGFEQLARRFHPMFWHEVGRRKAVGSTRGRKRKADSDDVLAVTLACLRDGVEGKHFQGHLGFGRTNTSRIQRLGLTVLAQTLSTMKSARIEWPDQAKMEEYVDMILERHPDLAGLISNPNP